jgi:DNA-binding FadR family transcriptional regulator
VLEAKQGSGTYVTDLAPDTLAEPLVFAMRRNGHFLPALLDVRIMLEVGAAEHAAERLEDGDLAHLRRVNDLIADALDDPERSIELDREFHRGIYAAAGNPILTALLDSIMHLGKRTRGRTLVRQSGPVLAQHAAIVDALALRSPSAAAGAMLEHLSYVRLTLPEQMDADDA